jgi:hypothetical protein
VLIIRVVHEMHKYTVWAKGRVTLMLKRAVRIVTAMFQRVMRVTLQ